MDIAALYSESSLKIQELIERAQEKYLEALAKETEEGKLDDILKDMIKSRYASTISYLLGIALDLTEIAYCNDRDSGENVKLKDFAKFLESEYNMKHIGLIERNLDEWQFDGSYEDLYILWFNYNNTRIYLIEESIECEGDHTYRDSYIIKKEYYFIANRIAEILNKDPSILQEAILRDEYYAIFKEYPEGLTIDEIANKIKEWT